MTIRRHAWQVATVRRLRGASRWSSRGWLAVVLALTFVSAAGHVDGDRRPSGAGVRGGRQANGRVLAAGDYVTIARSDDAGLRRRLYAAGALLVLDAEQAGGCSGLPPKRIAQL